MRQEPRGFGPWSLIELDVERETESRQAQLHTNRCKGGRLCREHGTAGQERPAP